MLTKSIWLLCRGMVIRFIFSYPTIAYFPSPILSDNASRSFQESASVSSAVPAPGFEGVPEMIVIKESEPKVIEPTIVEVSLPLGSSAPGCEEENACFIPFSVSINVGDTVVWSNDDSAAHTVTSGTPSNGPDGIFDSSIFMSATTFEQVFSESGNYDYFCMVHPWMVGQIQVN